jgi:hypothetical protein
LKNVDEFRVSSPGHRLSSAESLVKTGRVVNVGSVLGQLLRSVQKSETSAGSATTYSKQSKRTSELARYRLVPELLNPYFGR